jgi:hypothetical protein
VGTSVNQPSPKTINWRAAQATYRNADVPVLREMWRAATSQAEGNLASLLAQPIVARVRDIALQGGDATQVAMAASRAIAESGQSSFAAEIARRAAVQSVAAENRDQAYSERVFAEASNYLLSRDLPGYVGDVGRNKTVGDSFQFKRAVLEAAANVVRQVGPPQSGTPEAWHDHTTAVVDALKRRNR